MDGKQEGSAVVVAATVFNSRSVAIRMGLKDVLDGVNPLSTRTQTVRIAHDEAEKKKQLVLCGSGAVK
jgi:hypothetical protein